MLFFPYTPVSTIPHIRFSSPAFSFHEHTGSNPVSTQLGVFSEENYLSTLELIISIHKDNELTLMSYEDLLWWELMGIN